VSDPSFRFRWYPRVLLGVLGAAVVFAAFAGSDAETLSGPLGGDFPSFYGAGSIVADGHADRLYDAELQAAAQEDLIGEDGGFLYFAYPVFVAQAYAPLTLFSYRLAWVIHVMFMAFVLWAAIRLARPLLPTVLRSGDHELAALAVALVTYPILRAVLGGQNTTLTLFLLVAVWRFAADDNDALAGIALAAMLYKPQFGLPLLLLVMLTRRWRIVGWWGAGAAVLYVVSAFSMGLGWVGTWLRQAGDFDDLNIIVNGDLMVSAIGFFRNLIGPEAAAAAVAAGVVIVFVALPTGTSWWRGGASTVPVALAAPALVLVAPSALYYDAGLVLVTAAVALAIGVRAATAVTVVVVAVSWSQLAAETLGWSPLFFVLLAAWAWSAFGWRSERITPV
jgi:hypothetical protein